MKKAKLVVYRVRLAKVRGSAFWSWQMLIGAQPVLSQSHSEDKASFVRRCASFCRLNATAERPISLEILTRHDVHQSERTYPRFADPKRSKG